METINKKYKVTAQVLTPLSIGQGSEKDWVYGVDYLTQPDPKNSDRLLLYHLDLGKMHAVGVDINRISNFWATGDTGSVERLIGNKLNAICDFILPLPTGIGKQGLKNPIKTFLRNDLTNHPVLAGSSLKGALRSVLFSNLRTKEQKDNKSVFGDMKDGSDLMRFIRVGDFEFEETRLVNTKIYNLHKEGGEWLGGWKHDRNYTSSQFEQSGFNTIYECLPPRATSEGYIMFADKLFDKVDQRGNVSGKKSVLSDIRKLCRIVNDHSFDYIDKELDFFEEYGGQYEGNLYEKLCEIQEAINACDNSNSCILKMSAGSGFHSITGDWQYTNYRESVMRLDRKRGGSLPKSRKIAVSGTSLFLPMGFIKLTFTETK